MQRHAINYHFSLQQFKIHALLQLRYVDPRLVFREVAPNRKESIMGEKSLRDSLWTPHIFLANERSSSILGTSEKDVLTSVSPDGTVIISTRIQATLNCWMNLQKFPFDEQKCQTIFESCKCCGWSTRQKQIVHLISFRDVQHVGTGAALGAEVARHTRARTAFDRICALEHVDERDDYKCRFERSAAWRIR